MALAEVCYLFAFCLDQFRTVVFAVPVNDVNVYTKIEPLIVPDLSLSFQILYLFGDDLLLDQIHRLVLCSIACSSYLLFSWQRLVVSCPEGL